MKKKHPEHVNLERWLVSYADFITLLFAFFVVMYAISQADLAKLSAVANSMRDAFGQSGGPAGMLDMGSMGGNSYNQFDTPAQSKGRNFAQPMGKTNVASDPDPEIQTIRDKLEETITLDLGMADIKDKVRMEYDSRGLIVRVAAKDFFDEGSSEVHPDLRPLLDKIGKVLLTTPNLVRIEGHADILEQRPVNYPSAWELSTARAAWVARYWIRRLDFPGLRVGVAGYGSQRPVTLSDSVWERGANRRVEFIVLNNRYSIEEGQ